MTSKACKKTQSEMIQGADARQVALLKKASELFTLCPVGSTLVLFFPDDKVFTFGHLGVDAIINRLTKGEKPDFGAIQRSQADYEATLHQLNRQYSDLLELLEAEKKREAKLKQMTEGLGKGWWSTPIDDLSLEELLALQAKFEDFQGKLRKHMAKASIQMLTPTSTSAANSTGAVDPPLTIPAEGSSSADPHGHGAGHGD